MTIRNETNKNLIYSDIAEELGLDFVDVREICEMQFKELANHIRSNSREDFRLPYIGKIRHKTSKGSKSV